MTQARLERRPVKQSRGHHHQRIEPPARLRQIFDNEIRREMVFKPFFVFKRVMHLRVRHGARFKPAVKDVFDTAHCAFSCRIVGIRARQFINERTVQVGDLHAEIAFQLFNAAINVNARIARIVAFPYGNRRAPEAHAADRPVPRVFQPFTERTVFNVFGNPGNLLV